jgi:hypothetical protein
MSTFFRIIARVVAGIISVVVERQSEYDGADARRVVHVLEAEVVLHTRSPRWKEKRKA